MTARMAATLRNNRLDEITALMDAGAAGAKLVLYDGTQPATGGTATNEVATLTFSTTSFPAAGSGTMSANAITDDSDATGGTTTWARIVDSDDTFVLDLTVGTSGTDIIINSATVSAGAVVSCSSFAFTEGNP
jgi:hypothetical protein